MKKLVSLLLVLCMALSVCSLASADERQTVTLWYHSGDVATDAYYEKAFEEMNNAQDKYTFEYVSFAFADFQEKFQMAVMTNTMPDVVSLGFSNIATFVAQDTLLELNDYVGQLTNMDKIDEGLTTNLKAMGNGVLYGVPYAYNQEVAWYNTRLFAEKGIEAAPVTQKEFLELCEKFADKANGSYFYSLRGVRPYDSLLAWLFTYTDGCGYNGSWFDENGKCILRNASFVEALDVYANIYKNGWVSGDSVNNNFAEVVAEFGSGVSMYIIHNSSSEANHKTNLGEGNFASATVLANDAGRYYASGLQPNVFCVTKNRDAGHDYTGALVLVDTLLSAEVDGGMCEAVGRVPCNVEVTGQDWYKSNPNMMLVAGYLTDPNYVQILNPYWLSDFSNMISTDMTADFQALLLNEMTAEECLNKWADSIDQYQEEYLAGLQ